MPVQSEQDREVREVRRDDQRIVEEVRRLFERYRETARRATEPDPKDEQVERPALTLR